MLPCEDQAGVVAQCYVCSHGRTCGSCILGHEQRVGNISGPDNCSAIRETVVADVWQWNVLTTKVVAVADAAVEMCGSNGADSASGNAG